MGALLSLPVLSYILLPSFGTYAISFNLMFFYMTWSTLVLSNSSLLVEIIGTLAAHTLFFLLPATFFLLLDTAIPSLVVDYKAQGAAGLPTRKGGVKGGRKRKGTPLWWQVVGLSLLNITISVALQAGIELLLTEVLRVRSGLKITRAFPMPWSMARDVLCALAIREVVQYYTHRFLHSADTLPSRLHRSYNHSITVPYSFTAHYDHPIPYLLTAFLPIYLPSLLVRRHILTHLLILSVTSLESAFTYSGYTNLPIMANGMARRRDAHMKSGGRGNFAPWGVMDWMCGTTLGGNIAEDVQETGQKWLGSQAESGRRRSTRTRRA